MSCAGGGYLSGNMLVAYPFEDGKFLSWSGDGREMQLALQKCFVDAEICLSAHSASGGWPSIGAMSVGESGISFSIFASGAEVRLSASASRTKFPIISGKSAFGTYVVVVSSEGIRDFCSLCSAGSVSIPSGMIRLCGKCVNLSPEGLSSIRVFDGVKPREIGPHFVLGGDVAIRPGNNMVVDRPEDMASVDYDGIRITAEAGAGLGIIPCTCEQDEDTRIDSTLRSPDGHTRMFNDTCYDIEPNTKTGVIKMHAKCTACCTCDMYEEIVKEKLAPLADEIRKSKSDLDLMLGEYEDGVSKFNKRISSPTLSDIEMSLSGMPAGRRLGPMLDKTNVSGRMERCAFTAIVRNSSYFSVTAKVFSLSGTDEIVEVSAAVSDEEGVTSAVTGDKASAVVNKPFSILPGRSLAITFVSVKKTKVKSVKTGGFVGSASVGLSYVNDRGVSMSLGTLSRSVEV